MSAGRAAVPDAFDAHRAEFKEHQETPWGRLRYTLGLANIRRHLADGGPLRVLDAGSGNGPEAIVLAAAGHHVTLVDYAPGLLDDARQAAEAQGVAERLIVHHADLAAIPDLFPEPGFDLLLCHNVLQYVDDVAGAIHAICHPLRPGGLASIVCVNRYSEPYRLALMEHDPDRALAALEADTIVAGVFSLRAHARVAEDMYPLLEAAGCTVLARYGVRAVGDYMDNSYKLDPAFYEQLERLEFAVADRFPYYLLARFFQIIARKEG